MDSSLLDTNLDEKHAMFNQMFMNAASEDPSLLSALNQEAIPTTQVPAPQEMSEEDLIKLLESENPTGFRIPMSIGEPHAEMDKSGGGCTAYDVVVNPGFMSKMQASELFRTFFLTVMMEGLEDKYNMQLSREWIILKNRKFVGTLQTQNVRTKSKPVIMEMSQWGESPTLPASTLIQEVESREDIKSKGKEPDYRIVQEPAEGYPEFLVAEINLPQVRACSSLSLVLGEDRIVLETRSSVYHLDIYLPMDILQIEF
ncbi:PIHD1-like protein [Mya arenaria]|uniref:PIH1 domain-containing protein 1 n=1 Tax=Mya arenaria TaxID=6604 RepID=A0ABY7EEA1_MYAAR|nr:PIHD1-like protein [Mya arenaria]